MTLLVLMYHRAGTGAFANTPQMLNRHFELIASRYRVVLPGEPLAADQINVCLTFDDAYFDFYVRVLPLLAKHNLRAVLGVPTGAILDHTLAPWTERLDLANELAFAEPARGGFCTWTELEEIIRSGRVALAAHGHHHVPLDTTDADLTTEIDLSHARLQERLAQPVNSFVFPFGRYSRRALNRAVQRYRHVFRIGGAINRGWDRNPLYRVDADQMTSPDALFTASHLSTCRFRYVWNRLRGR